MATTTPTPTTTEVSESKVLTDEQKAELAAAKQKATKDKGKKIAFQPLEGDPSEVEIVRTGATFIEVKRDGKIERYHFPKAGLPVMEAMFDKVVSENADQPQAKATAKGDSKGARKEQCAAVLHAVRKDIRYSSDEWKSFDPTNGESIDDYIERLQAMIGHAQDGVKLAKRFKKDLEKSESKADEPKDEEKPEAEDKTAGK